MADIGKQTPCKISKKPYYTIIEQYIYNEKEDIYICKHIAPKELLPYPILHLIYDCLTQTRENGSLDIVVVKQYLDMYFEKEESILYFECIKELNSFIQEDIKKESEKKPNTITFNEDKAKK